MNIGQRLSFNANIVALLYYYETGISMQSGISQAVDVGQDKEEKTSHPVLKTLHILPNAAGASRGCSFFQCAGSAEIDKPELIRELYAKFLVNDSWFHYFFEPDLIIRISNPRVLADISHYLDQMDITFKTYSYPHPEVNESSTSGRCYGEAEGGPVAERLYDIYLPLFHINALAALTMEADKRLCFMERSNHTFCNMANDTRQEEADKLEYLASRKTERKM